jgi:uncharacterized membrane protein
MRLLAEQTGQMLVLGTLGTLVAAVAVDVGAWYRADRAVQSTADGAALAAARALPADPSRAERLARSYTAANAGGLRTVAFGSSSHPNDTVTVEVERSAPGFFSRVLGVDAVSVEARASARVTPAVKRGRSDAEDGRAGSAATAPAEHTAFEAATVSLVE